MTCRDLIPFVDGELSPLQADAFRDHLTACLACRAGLLWEMQMSVRLSRLEPAVRLRLRTPDYDALYVVGLLLITTIGALL